MPLAKGTGTDTWQEPSARSAVAAAGTFGMHLLCEQVVGRGLRRLGYSAAPYTLDLPNGRRRRKKAHWKAQVF